MHRLAELIKPPGTIVMNSALRYICQWNRKFEAEEEWGIKYMKAIMN